MCRHSPVITETRTVGTMTENQSEPPRESGGNGAARGSGSRHKSRRNNRGKPKPKPPEFEGSTEELKGQVFNCTGRDMANLFAKTKQKLEVCAGTQCGGAMAAAVQKLKEPTVPATPDPAGHKRGDADPWKAMAASDGHRSEAKEKEAAKKVTVLDPQKQKLCSVIIGPCTEAILARIELHKGFPTVSKDRTAIGLLKIIQTIMLDIQDQTCVAQSVCVQKRQLHKMEQGPHETVPQHCERFQKKIHVTEQMGGSFGFEPE